MLAKRDWNEHFWNYKDLRGFIQQMRDVSLTCLRTPEDYYRIATECFADLAAQHVLYAEMLFAARGPESPYPIPYHDIVTAIEQARLTAESQFPIRIGLVACLIRDKPHGSVRMVREAIAELEKGAGLVGIDLVGNETEGQDFAALAPAYHLAHEASLGLAAHAGEAAGPESCWGALRILGARRLGHATLAGSDSSLVNYMKSEHITLTMCPTSNLRTGVISSLEKHPIRAFYRRGIPVTVNSDDPMHFGTNLTNEYLLLAHRLGFSLSHLRQLTINAAAGAFQPATTRATLRAEVQQAWSVAVSN